DRLVHNLTVDGLHTYYVGVGATAVLTHNDDPNCPVDAARRLADQTTSITGKKRPQVSEAIRLTDGTPYQSTSFKGERPVLHPLVEGLLGQVPRSLQGRGHARCGLPVCLSEALWDGRDPTGAEAAAVLVRSHVDHKDHGKAIGPCGSCQVLEHYFDLNFLTKDD
ncbi:YwqJ-related putative deaminase, partial [Actinosynnema sp. NPDC059797]